MKRAELWGATVRRRLQVMTIGGLVIALLLAMVPASAGIPQTNSPRPPGAPGSTFSGEGAAARQSVGVGIARPNRAYRRATCKMRFEARAVGRRFSSVRACSNRVTISRRARRAQVPTSWRTWSAPPFAEDATPAVAFLPRDNIRFTFRRTVRVAGFEIEPNTRSTARVTVRFFDRNGDLLRLIRRNVDGNAGARLFALAVRRPRIKRMSVQVEDDAGFAVAQIRIAR